MTDISVKKRILVSATLTLLVVFPVELAGFPAQVSVLVPAASVAWAAPVPGALGNIDSGAQLEQAREYMERQVAAQRVMEDESNRKARVETNLQKPEESAPQVITFTLNKVETDKSVILTEAELNAITGPYTGKTVSLQDLYGITGAINKLYADKGYMVCRAYLPPQRIHEGAVRIGLLEGKTGKVTVQGLRHTRLGYLTHRVPIEEGTVANTNDLNRELQRFNATNDMQLRIAVHAGEQPGTTDYEIMAYEPKNNHTVTLYLDNNGYENSGRFRQGIFYTMRSVTGQRDSLRLNYLRSKGTNMLGTGYSLPLNNRGTRLDIDYSANTTKITKGNLKDVGVKGHAYNAGLTLRHPLLVDQTRRYEAGLQYLHSHSVTDLGTNTGTRVNWVDDTRNTYIPYVSFAHYGDSSIFYHKHSFPITNWNGAYDNRNDYISYQLDMLYNKKYKHGQMLAGRLNAQLAGDKDRSSADRFYAGGANSVRGYEESFYGGNQGVTAGLTWQAPLNKKRTLNAFTFFDYGWVKSNDANASSYSLYSAGLGLSGSYKDVYASLTVGFPLKKEYEFTTEKVSSARLDFVCSATF